MLRARVRDKVTGFVGIATGRVEYITGCNQVLVSPPVKQDGDLPDSKWFDEQRMEVLEEDFISPLDNTLTPGAGEPAPIK